MSSWPAQDARCLVTGASSGIGRAIAEALAARGARLLLTGRSAERLEALAASLDPDGADPGRITTFVADLADPAARGRLIEAAATTFDGALDLVVNSAGLGAFGRFESHDASIARTLFEVNVLALMDICRGALPLLRRGRRPAVINVGSVVARRALPGRSEYSATKHAVAGFTDAIRAEWAREGIHVMLLNPGFTDTPFERNALADTAFYKTQSRRFARPEDVARAALRGLDRGLNERTLSAQGRLLVLVNRLAPRFVDRGLARWTRRVYDRGLGRPG